MEWLPYVLVPLAAVFVSGLTLYSGFGLGTLLMPVFALFFPLPVAVAATGLVHWANGAFKVGVVGRKAQWRLVLLFGIPAIIAAAAGGWVLWKVAGLGLITSYQLGPHIARITPIKLVIGGLMLVFAAFELLPGLRDLKFHQKYLPLGGVLSGFFGGLSGHQGALRSAFLVKTGVSKEAFVGTNAVCGFMVDASRMAMYGFAMLSAAGNTPVITREHWPLIVLGTVAAFAGVMIGKQFLHKVTIQTVQMVTGVLLTVVALGLMSGLI